MHQHRQVIARRLQLALHASRMRAVPTPSERKLWEALRSRALGVAVRRQVVIRERIVDFFVPSARLVIEVDGRYHTERRVADERRDAALQRSGHHVLHVAADEVMRQLPAVLERIRTALAEHLP
jgi:very-short-patch-repair endonuclease